MEAVLYQKLIIRVAIAGEDVCGEMGLIAGRVGTSVTTPREFSENFGNFQSWDFCSPKFPRFFSIFFVGFLIKIEGIASFFGRKLHEPGISQNVKWQHWIGTVHADTHCNVVVFDE